MYKMRRMLATIMLSMIIGMTSLSVVGFAEITPGQFVDNGDYRVSNIEDTDIAEFADSTKANSSWTAADAKKIESLLKKYNKQDYDGDDKVTIGTNKLTRADAEKVKAEIASIARSKNVKSQVDEIGLDFNVKADIETASESLSGFRNIISWVVGIMVFVVTICMTLFTACDICYITMPVFRNKCDDMKTTGGVGTKSTSSGENKLLFVTDDAQYAVQTCTVETGKNPLGLYLKKRVLAFIMLGLVLFILLTGNINLIVNLVVNIASGIISALSMLGG